MEAYRLKLDTQLKIKLVRFETLPENQMMNRGTITIGICFMVLLSTSCVKDQGIDDAEGEALPDKHG